MHRPRLAFATFALAGLALAACSSGAGTSPAAGGAAAGTVAADTQPAAARLNPVDLVRKAGAIPAAGSEVGSTDAKGNRFANGEFGTGGATEGIRVYVWTDPTTTWPPEPSDDSHWIIRGEGWEADLTGVLNLQSGGIEYSVTPEVVAQRLGGTVVPRG
jgi:hypothetical protein